MSHIPCKKVIITSDGIDFLDGCADEGVPGPKGDQGPMGETGDVGPVGPGLEVVANGFATSNLTVRGAITLNSQGVKLDGRDIWYKRQPPNSNASN